MLKVLTPAPNQNLTTFARLVEMLPEIEEAGQARAERFIAQASAAAVAWCRRPFALERVREAHYSAGNLVALERTPVVAIESVWFDNALVDPENYRWDERTNTLYRLNPSSRRDECWPHGELHIVYWGGYVLPSFEGDDAPTLPESVELACVLIVAAYNAMLGRDPTIRSETIEGVGSTSWIPSATAIPDAEAARLLAPYRRLF